MNHAALPQHPLFFRSLALMGASPDLIGTDDGPVIVVRRRFGPLRLAAALRAPPLSAPSLRHLRRNGVRLCEPEGPGNLRDAGFRQVVTGASIAELDLSGDARARRARMDRKWRGHLNRAERAGLTLRDGAFAGRDAVWLVARELAQRRARRYRTLHPDFARAWATADPGAARLFVAEQEGERIAAMLFLIHGSAASYHIGWSGAAGRAVSAHHLLLARAGDWLAERGVGRIDLGTVDTGASPGLARFKLGSGARLRLLGGSWIAVPGW